MFFPNDVDCLSSLSEHIWPWLLGWVYRHTC